jgi:probable F420-dependent oxidoreductase
MTIRIGVQIEPQATTFASFAHAVRQVEALGVDTIWTWDHFFPLHGDPNAGHFEGWTLLTAMAMLTSRAEIGCMVICNSYRNPALLAHMAKTLDHISGGRAILGIGAGWFERDYVEFGYEFGTAAERLRHLRDALPVILQRLDAEIPQPVRHPMPLLIGGGGEKVTLRLTAQYATMWNGFGPPEAYRHKNAVLDEWCRSIDRNPAEIERTVMAGDAAQFDALVEAGAQHLIISIGDPWDFGKVERLLTWRANRGH